MSNIMNQRRFYSPQRARNRGSWDLFKEFDDAFNQLQRSVDPQWTETGLDATPVFQPAADIRENEKGYLLAFDMPGLCEKDVKIEVHDGILSVTGERRFDQRKEDQGWTRRERAFGRFQRSFSLPNDVDANNIEAQVENGELHLFLPKTEAARPVAVPVRNAPSAQGEHKSFVERFFGSKDVKSETERQDSVKSKH